MNAVQYIPGEKVWLRNSMGSERVDFVRCTDSGNARVQKGNGGYRTVELSQLSHTSHETPPIPPSLERRPTRASVEFSPQPKVLPVRDRDYLTWLRGLPCTFCGQDAQRCEASHHGKHGTGTKPGDHDALPACTVCHGRHHQKGSPAPWMDDLTREERAAFFQMRAAQLRERWSHDQG